MMHLLVTEMNRYLIIILLLLPFLGKSQVVSDAKLWTAISINKKVNDFEFSFSQENRFDENFSHVDKVFTELGAEYEITKSFSGSFGYRFARENDYEARSYDLSSRFDFGLEYKVKYEQFRFGYKVKYQTKTASPTENNPTYLRNKLTVQYKLEKITPFISYEFFYQFNDEKVINRIRTSLGGKYSINDNHAIKLYYILENRFNTKRLQRNHIWGIGYSIDI